MSQRQHPVSFPENVTQSLIQYITETFVDELPEQQMISEQARQQDIPAISLYPVEGWLIYVLAKLAHVKTAIEIGTLAGYSASWLARALPADGKLYTLELDPERAEFARQNLTQAGFGHKTEVIVGDALASLNQITEPVQLLFIDAEKTQYPAYLDWAVEHMSAGGLIMAHNAFAQGDILYNPTELNEMRQSYVEAVQIFNQRIAEDDRLTGMIMPLGDGLMCAVINERDVSTDG